MASLDATDINSLPMNPSTGGSNLPANIVLQKNEKMENSIEHISQMRENELKQMAVGSGMNGSSSQMPSALEQNTINSLISGLQQASASGLTTLPSRDIPQMTNTLTQDQQIKPNYIPQSNNNNYIDDETTSNQIMNEHMRRQNKSNTLDVMYEELQVPILLAILFFMFQLPIFRTYLFRFLPSLFNKDGNPNLSGYVVNSVLFALLYYVIKNFLNYFTTI
jgi:hypothetical protein